MSLNILFAGTPAFAAVILQSLYLSDHHILGIFTQPDRPRGRGQHDEMSPVKQFGLNHQIPVFQAETLKDPQIQTQIASFNADIMVVVAYGLLLPEAVLKLPRLGCINVHASILPRFRGAAPIQYAILAGDHETGVTIMQMDAGLDSGDILSIKTCPIEKNDTSGTLAERLAQLGSQALLQTLNDLENQNVQPIPQEHAKASFAPKIQKTQARIRWTESAQVIEHKIRAFLPWPVAYFEHQTQMIRVFTSEVLKGNGQAAAGTVLAFNENGLDIATGENTLRILEIQLPGKKRLPIQDIFHGKPNLFIPGQILFE